MSRKLTSREFLIASATMAGGAIIAACAAPQEPTPVSKPAVVPTATKAPTAVPPAPTVVEPKEGGILRCAYSSQRDDLCPMFSLGRVNIDSNQRIYASLTMLDWNYELMPYMAESWEISADGTTYTFNLHKGMKFHDGKSVTAKDVAFTYNMNAHPACASAQASKLDAIKGYQEVRDGAAETLEGVKTPDDFTVICELGRPLSAFLENVFFVFVFPEHALAGVKPEDIRTNPFWSTLPFGCGPYKLTKYVPKQTLEYERHVDFHLGKPYIEKMIWTVIPSRETQILALEKDELDYVYSIGSDADTIERIKKNPDLFIMEGLGPRVSQMAINWDAFPDKRVRQAIIHAIDRDALLTTVGGPEISIKTQYYFQNPWASEGATKLDDVYDYNPEKAKALLDEAEWDFERELKIHQRGTEPSAQMVIIQEMLQAVGLKVKLQMEETINTVLYETGEYDFAIAGFAPPDPYSVAQRFTCDSRAPNGTSLTMYCNPEFDVLVQQAERATTKEQQAELYRQMQAKLLEDAVSVLLPRTPNRAAFRSRVHADTWAWYAMDGSWMWWMET